MAWSDEFGKATITGLAPTTYYLRVEKPGYCATNAGSAQCLVVPPAAITVTMAPIDVVRAVIENATGACLTKLTMARNSQDRVSSLGALDAAQRQQPGLLREMCWATLDLTGDDVKRHETIAVVFSNGSRKVVELTYQRLAQSRPVSIAPGPDSQTFEVDIEAASSLRPSLPVQARVARLGDDAISLKRNEYEAAADLKVPCRLRLPPGIYSISVSGVDGKWFQGQGFSVLDSPVSVRFMSSEPLVPVTFRRQVPFGYMPGLWNIRFGTAGYPIERRQCTPLETEITVLAPAGQLHYIAMAPGLADLDATSPLPPTEAQTVLLIRQTWE